MPLVFPCVRLPLCSASAHDLVSDPFIKRGLKTPRMVEMLLKDIPTVGGKGLQSGGGPGGQDADGKPAGYGKLSLRSSGDDDGTGADGGVSLVPGTTWIFPDELKEQLGIGQYSNNYAGGGGMGLGAGAGVDYSNSSLGASGIAPGPDGPAYHDGALDGSLSGAGDGSGVGDGTAGGVGGGGMLHHHLSHSSHHELGGMVYGDEGEEDTSLDAVGCRQRSRRLVDGNRCFLVVLWLSASCCHPSPPALHLCVSPCQLYLCPAAAGR